jgi:hypothetical protein
MTRTRSTPTSGGTGRVTTDDDVRAGRRGDHGERRRRRDGGERRRHDDEDDVWTSDLLFDAARLQLNTYNRLLDLSAKYTDRVIESVRAYLDPLRRAPTARRHHRPITISGTLGEEAEATRAIEITNRLATAAQVALSVSEFRHDDGGAPFSAAARFRSAPRDRTLDPGETRDFWMAVQLDEPFRAGERYYADVHVVMRGRLVQTVSVEVEVEKA